MPLSRLRHAEVASRARAVSHHGWAVVTSFTQCSNAATSTRRNPPRLLDQKHGDTPCERRRPQEPPRRRSGADEVHLASTVRSSPRGGWNSATKIPAAADCGDRQMQGEDWASAEALVLSDYLGRLLYRYMKAAIASRCTAVTGWKVRVPSGAVHPVLMPVDASQLISL